MANKTSYAQPFGLNKESIKLKKKKMKPIIFICLLILAVSCATTKNNIVNTNSLNGTWKPIKQEMGGRGLPNVVFEKQQLIISDSNYTLVAESIDKGIVKYQADKMDIYGKEGVNTGKHFTAIYKYENGQLTICYNLVGSNYPEAFDTKGKPMYFLSVFNKVL
jgi:uncharacterized protein (TIGR03067 family)